MTSNQDIFDNPTYSQLPTPEAFCSLIESKVLDILYQGSPYSIFHDYADQSFGGGMQAFVKTLYRYGIRSTVSSADVAAARKTFQEHLKGPNKNGPLWNDEKKLEKITCAVETIVETATKKVLAGLNGYVAAVRGEATQSSPFTSPSANSAGARL